uniref:Uncharacterized protein n=1 Tax=Phlebotomus papatasi TaxID=29031 RepID=A0A1B0DPB0_PHLPP
MARQMEGTELNATIEASSISIDSSTVANVVTCIRMCWPQDSLSDHQSLHPHLIRIHHKILQCRYIRHFFGIVVRRNGLNITWLGHLRFLLIPTLHGSTPEGQGTQGIAFFIHKCRPKQLQGCYSIFPAHIWQTDKMLHNWNMTSHTGSQQGKRKRERPSLFWPSDSEDEEPPNKKLRNRRGKSVELPKARQRSRSQFKRKKRRLTRTKKLTV